MLLLTLAALTVALFMHSHRAVSPAQFQDVLERVRNLERALQTDAP